jgi:uroporphyrinogen-III synthase
MRGNISILITTAVNTSLVDELVAKGFDVDVIPFIQINTIKTKKIQQQIADALMFDATVIFTSNNAVNAVTEYLQNQKPNWSIYCIGNTTKALIEKLFDEASIVATGDDAGTLANKIIRQQKLSREVYFFCGDKKRNELPELLKQNNIKVNEVEVYTTTILNHSVEKKYDAVLFFSPSGVQGFFENNSGNEKTVLLAIGDTTANEIKKFSKNKIIVSDKPGKKELVEQVVIYFAKPN